MARQEGRQEDRQEDAKKLGRMMEAGYSGKKKNRRTRRQKGGKPGMWEYGKVGRNIGVGGCN